MFWPRGNSIKFDRAFDLEYLGHEITWSEFDDSIFWSIDDAVQSLDWFCKTTESRYLPTHFLEGIFWAGLLRNLASKSEYLYWEVQILSLSHPYFFSFKIFRSFKSSCEWNPLKYWRETFQKFSRKFVILKRNFEPINDIRHYSLARQHCHLPVEV